MNLDFRINKDTCFYYWVQAISGWDIDNMDAGNMRYREMALAQLDSGQLSNLEIISKLIAGHEDPRKLLSQLYVGNLEFAESIEIAYLSKQLTDIFETVWRESLSELEYWKETLPEFINKLDGFDNEINKIVYFFDSSFDANKKYPVYLVQNQDFMSAVGLTIEGADFILLRPSGYKKKDRLRSTASVLVHEYVHLIERESSVDRQLFRSFYEKGIASHNIPSPKGFSWKMMYVEAIVYAFSNNITRGLLSETIHAKQKPTVEEFRHSFDRMLKEKRHKTTHIISWVALGIVEDLRLYLYSGRKIDIELADKITNIYARLYLTYKND